MMSDEAKSSLGMKMKMMKRLAYRQGYNLKIDLIQPRNYEKALAPGSRSISIA